MAELYPTSTPIKGTVIGITSAPVAHLERIEGQSSEFQTALVRLETAANGFISSSMIDPAVRADYMVKVRAAADGLMDEVKMGVKTPHEGAQAANALRNEILRLARADLTTFGLALSKDMKPDGKPLEYYGEKNANELFNRPFEQLTKSEQDAVWRYTIDRAGNANGTVNGFAKLYGHAGRALLVMSLAIAVYRVLESDNKTRQGAKEGLGLGASIAGGAASAAAVGFIVSNPAGWVVGVAIFVGAAATGYGSDEVFEYYWPER
jgi:hypothetical protein